MCEMCFMPLGSDLENAGTENNGQKSAQYCKYCYQDGKIQYDKNDIKEFQNLCYEGMLKNGMWKPRAWYYSWLIQFAPYWKNKSPEDSNR
jgi:hypothetical protein